MLGALRRAIEGEHAERGRHRVDDADHCLLPHRCFVGPREREQHGAAAREGERVPVSRLALDRVAVEDRHRDAEGGDLREREVDEDHAAREHVQPEPGVHGGEHQARQEGPEQQLDHCVRRFAFSSNRPR